MEQTNEEKNLSRAFYKSVMTWAPEEWVERINGITDELCRNRVAAMVWWDMSQRRDDMQPVLAMCQAWIFSGDREEFPPNQLSEGLVQVGYPPHIVKERGRTKCKWAQDRVRQKIVTERNGKVFLPQLPSQEKEKTCPND